MDQWLMHSLARKFGLAAELPMPPHGRYGRMWFRVRYYCRDRGRIAVTPDLEAIVFVVDMACSTKVPYRDVFRLQIQAPADRNNSGSLAQERGKGGGQRRAIHAICAACASPLRTMRPMVR